MREGYCEIPEPYKIPSRPYNPVPGMRIGIMSDLHMTNKPARINAVLNRMKDMDMVLMVGDLVNNCDSSQYERLINVIEAILPDKPIFAVAGNHDISESAAQNYQCFERWLHGRTERQYPLICKGNGAFGVMLNHDVDLIGLNPLYSQKIFHFPDKGAQLKWLERYLAGSPAKQHIIMCHAPLLAHNPQRDVLKKSPYLAQDEMLQNIVDKMGNIIFLSGHTHLSPNIPAGCVEYDSFR